jgi:hypothetical protein
MNDLTLRPPTQEEIAQARLPARYEAARTAIAECERIDELKDVADKQAALCSYFRLSRDTTLHNLALRIQQRAQRRMGELLKLIPAASSSNLVQHRQDGAVPSVTRTAAADAAGLSERQRKTALRIANVPQQEFERAVESDSPPTVTQLAERGRTAKPLPDPAPIPAADHYEVAETQSALRAFAEFCAEHDPANIAAEIASADAESLVNFVSAIDAWLDRFVTNLPSRRDGIAA